MNNNLVVSLMFHRVADQSQQFHPEKFADYLKALVEQYPIVIPGEKLNAPLSLCLTFDDAYYDFYRYVFPLLQKHQVKAILAVPTKYILDKTTQPSKVRLSVPYAYNMEDPSYAEKAPLCTWQELKEMSQTPYVVMASHGHRHANLAKPCDTHQEIVQSKKILEEKLNKPISYFVYPFGRMTRTIHKEICQHYDYGIRIGGALNRGWDEKNRFVYRVNADPFWLNTKSFDKALIRKLTYKYWLNKIRMK